MNKKTFISLLNKDIAVFSTKNNYFETLGESLCGIIRVLESYNVDCEGLLLQNINTEQGRKSWQIDCVGFGEIFLTYSWYKMPSGRYEITAYFM